MNEVNEDCCVEALPLNKLIIPLAIGERMEPCPKSPLATFPMLVKTPDADPPFAVVFALRACVFCPVLASSCCWTACRSVSRLLFWVTASLASFNVDCKTCAKLLESSAPPEFWTVGTLSHAYIFGNVNSLALDCFAALKGSAAARLSRILLLRTCHLRFHFVFQNTKSFHRPCRQRKDVGTAEHFPKLVFLH